jgi:hypothetical protein
MGRVVSLYALKWRLNLCIVLMLIILKAAEASKGSTSYSLGKAGIHTWLMRCRV